MSVLLTWSLVALLHEQSPVYAGRTPFEAARLRARFFVALAETGVPRDALPVIVAELEQGHAPISLAAAARAAATAGPSASAAAPHLVRLLQADFHDEQVTLDSSGLTNVRIEAVRALGAIGPDAGEDVLPALRALAEDRSFAANRLGPALHGAIEAAIAQIAPAPSCHTAAPPVILALGAPWRDPAQREAPVLPALEVKDLADRPLALTFFYTRCDNDRKCETNLARLAQLQAAAETAGLASRVRLVAVTYDPGYDTPLQLARFANARNLRPGDGFRLVRPSPSALANLAHALDLGVNYADGRPNIHGVELFVLDRQGRVAREYRNALWNERDVLADLERLAGE